MWGRLCLQEFLFLVLLFAYCNVTLARFDRSPIKLEFLTVGALAPETLARANEARGFGWDTYHVKFKNPKIQARNVRIYYETTN